MNVSTANSPLLHLNSNIFPTQENFQFHLSHFGERNTLDLTLHHKKSSGTFFVTGKKEASSSLMFCLCLFQSFTSHSSLNFLFTLLGLNAAAAFSVASFYFQAVCTADSLWIIVVDSQPLKRFFGVRTAILTSNLSFYSRWLLRQSSFTCITGGNTKELYSTILKHNCCWEPENLCSLMIQKILLKAKSFLFGTKIIFYSNSQQKFLWKEEFMDAWRPQISTHSTSSINSLSEWLQLQPQ